jgi:hypothetical protein
LLGLVNKSESWVEANPPVADNEISGKYPARAAPIRAFAAAISLAAA